MGVRGDLDTLLERRSRLELEDLKTPGLRRRCSEVRVWQSARLARTYEDLSSDRRYAPVVTFLLEDLFGMRDFARRARDLVRAWDGLRIALPENGLELLRRTVEFEVLTDELDHATATQLGSASVTQETYAAAYRAVGQRRRRERQIDLVVALGVDLDRAARNPLVAAALTAAHIPARVAGFGILQSFLERGHAAFRAMHGETDLLNIVWERETLLMERLFTPPHDPFDTSDAQPYGMLIQ